jgi:hypothetical protein
MHRFTHRATLAAAGALSVALQACCAQKWRLDEPGKAALADAAPAGASDLSIDGCALSGATGRLVERATWILKDEEATLVDYTARIKKALTEGEREALTTKRAVLLDGMLAQVDQLNAVISQATVPPGTSSVAIVYTATDVATVGSGLPPVVKAKFDHIAVVGPTERQAGIVVSPVAPRLALGSLVDDMERFASNQEVLTPETRERLKTE